MYQYQAIRISVNGKPTYGDKYVTIVSDKKLEHNQIVTWYNERVLILFEEV